MPQEGTGEVGGSRAPTEAPSTANAQKVVTFLLLAAVVALSLVCCVGACWRRGARKQVEPRPTLPGRDWHGERGLASHHPGPRYEHSGHHHDRQELGHEGGHHDYRHSPTHHRHLERRGSTASVRSSTHRRHHERRGSTASVHHRHRERRGSTASAHSATARKPGHGHGRDRDRAEQALLAALDGLEAELHSAGPRSGPGSRLSRRRQSTGAAAPRRPAQAGTRMRRRSSTGNMRARDIRAASAAAAAAAEASATAEDAAAAEARKQHAGVKHVESAATMKLQRAIAVRGSEMARETNRLLAEAREDADHLDAALAADRERQQAHMQKHVAKVRSRRRRQTATHGAAALPASASASASTSVRRRKRGKVRRQSSHRLHRRKTRAANVKGGEAVEGGGKHKHRSHHRHRHHSHHGHHGKGGKGKHKGKHRRPRKPSRTRGLAPVQEVKAVTEGDGYVPSLRTAVNMNDDELI